MHAPYVKVSVRYTRYILADVPCFLLVLVSFIITVRFIRLTRDVRGTDHIVRG